MTVTKENRAETGLEIAVIGMAGRFPGAKNIDEFWDNLKNGVEAVEFLSDDELKEAGVKEGLLNNPNYVKASAALEEKEYFDASFFGYSPQEAELMDPQMRLLHECSWEALEDAGYDPGTYPGLIGFYAGSANSFLWEALAVVSGKSAVLGGFASDLLIQNGFISTRISHKLDLQGPSLSIFTTCSTSLVAIHLACRALLTGECDMALAGGAAVGMARRTGYIYQEGMVFSPDGHCRAFDADARGSIFGEGVGIVVLKRFKEVVADKDNIYAVVKGSAVNNDGMAKVSFTAPGKRGQQAVIRNALTIARVVPESITYVETHGTSTALGDPIEIEALKDAFKTNKREYCSIGSVKTNVGHLDTAAGVVGFIKTVLALKHRLIPPSLNFETPNPNIDFKNSPFYVNTKLSRWKNEKYPLRAGVSSFGIGGTNAHIILEEAPEIDVPPGEREWNILVFSGKTESVLQRMTENFTAFLKKNPGINLANAAYTLQVGRRVFQYRSMLTASTINDAIDALSNPESRRVKTCFSPYDDRNLVFMFSGLGGQYVNMGLELYRKEPVFRDEMDRCFDILKPLVDYDIKEVLYPGLHPPVVGIDQPEIVQPIVFIFEYALAKLLMKWRITPSAMIGYSFGEYAAAAVSGVFSLEDALKLIVLRGQLIQKLSPGAMLSVPLSSGELAPFLTDEIDLCVAIDNGPSCVVAGPEDAVAAFERRMKYERILCMRLQAFRAIHSKMMEPILKEFGELVSQITLYKPQIPYISNVSGTFITDEEAVDPVYWVRHLRETVQFAAGIRKLLNEEDFIFVEIGPGHDLSSLVVRHLEDGGGHRVVNLIRPPQKDIPDLNYLLNKIGQLWLYGKSIYWQAFYTQEKRQRVSIPPYPFERKRYWIDGDPFQIGAEKLSGKSSTLPGKRTDIADWFYMESWKRSCPVDCKMKMEKGLGKANWLVFTGERPFCSRLVSQLQEDEKYEYVNVTVVSVGSSFTKVKDREYQIDPGNLEDYHRLLKDIYESGQFPQRVLHLWGITESHSSASHVETIDRAQELGFYSLLYLVQAMGRQQVKRSETLHIIVVTNDMQEVTGQENLCPGKSTVLGLVKVIPQEHPNIVCRSVDLTFQDIGKEQGQEDELILIQRLLQELARESSETITAFRWNYRWVQTFEPKRLEEPEEAVQAKLFRDRGVYLITGGLGRIGLVLAEFLAKQVKVRLILTGRSFFPARDQWGQWLADHDEDDPISSKIRKVRELEVLGAEVMIFSADAGNPEQMQEVVSQGETQFGPVNGVIHCAGIIEGKSVEVIDKITRYQCQEQFQAKIYGLLALEKIFQDKMLDFCWVMSSIASVLGGLGFVAYAAANSFMNAFVTRHDRLQGINSTPWISVNWDGMEPEATVSAFLRILALEDVKQVIVSTGGRLRERINRWVKLESLRQDKEEDVLQVEAASFHPRPDLTSPYVAASKPHEQRLVTMWQKLFGFEQIGIRDNFFELGGDSLKAIIVISRIHRELNVEVPIVEFFNRPTIEGLVQYIETADQSAFLAIEPAEEKEYYPLSAAQRRFYILHQLDLDSTAYCMPLTVRLEGRLDVGRIKEAFLKLIQRHESLRTSFELIDGEACQRVYNIMDFPIEYTEAPESEAKKIITNFVKPFDLARAPLLRMGLVKLEEEKHLLMLTMDHMISDGVSLVIFIKDLIALYSGNWLPLLRLQYRDFCQWQHNLLSSGRLEDQEAYWMGRFSGECPVLNMPTDYERPAIQSFEGDHIDFCLDEDLTEKVNRLIRETGTTLYMVLLAVYTILLSKYSGQTDIIIGTPIAGRNHIDLDNIMGLFLETLVIKNYPQESKTFEEFLEEVKENTLAAFENQSYPFSELIKLVGKENERSRNPVFDTMLIVQNIESVKFEPKDLTITPVAIDSRVSKVDITLEAREREKEVHFVLEYCTKLFKKETMERLITFFKEILSIVVDSRKIKLKDIRMSHAVRAAESDVFEDDGTDFDF